jgi:hypothetical protein
MGGGMAVAYHRRPVMLADDSSAAAMVKLGSGITGLGFYMYHGGTNPDGLTPLEETQLGWNGYNDLEAKSYDFQAPLGEFGQENESYRTIRTLGLFLADFGSELAPMPAYFPSQLPRDRFDRTTPRASARLDGKGRGFIFINNYERNYPLDDKPDFRVALRLPAAVPVPSGVPVPTAEAVPIEEAVPFHPTTIPDGAYMIWPVNMEIGGATLRYATAQPVCQLSDPETVVFFAWPGLPAEFAFAAAPGIQISAPGSGVAREADGTYLIGIAPGPGPAIEIQSGDGRQTQIIVLTRGQALQLAKARIGGRDRLAISAAAMIFNGEGVRLTSRNPANIGIEFFPALRPGAGFRESGEDGIFRRYVPEAKFGAESFHVEVTPVKAAEPSLPAKINPNPQRHVAMEPDDADFARAAVWHLSFPGGAPPAADRVLLRISYEGDVARLYAGSRLADDNFYKGPTWEIGLWRFTPRELEGGLDLKILPLRRDTPLFLEASARPAFPPSGDALSLKAVTLAPEYQTEMRVRE